MNGQLFGVEEDDYESNRLNADLYSDYILEDDINGEPGIDDFLNVDDIDEEVYLVQVPEYLAKAWLEAQSEGKEIGVLKKYQEEVCPVGTNANTEYILHLPEEYTHIPRDYTFSLKEKVDSNNYIFEEFKNKTGTKIVGRIVGDGHVKAVPTDPMVQKIIRDRTIEAGEKNGNITFINSNKRQLEHLRPISYAGASRSSSNKKHKNRLDNRQARIPEDDLRAMLFRCFEKYSYWSLNGLISETKQPTAHVKSVLGQIAFVNKRGEHHGLYQLHEQYASQSNNVSNNVEPNALNKEVESSVAEDDDEQDDFEEVE